jgi:predicted RND superfamily exporter protein
MNRYTEFLIRNRTLILVLVGCLTLVCLGLLRSLRINDDFDELALRNDTDFRFFERFLEQLGYDEILVVAFETEDVLSKESLTFIQRLESVLAEVPHVAKAMSLASAMDKALSSDDLTISPRALARDEARIRAVEGEEDEDLLEGVEGQLALEYRAALLEAKGNKSLAAKLLGLPESTFRYRLKKYRMFLRGV